MINRRHFVGTPALIALASALPARAEEGERHGLSYFGDLALPPDFKHFAYANPDAPKGGTIILNGGQWYFNQNIETFNTFNTFIVRGDAPYNMERIFASLLCINGDEEDSYYAYVAQGVSVSADRRTLRFRLNPAARFHDNSPLTAHDVAWTLMTFKEKGHPTLRTFLATMEAAEAESETRLKVTLNERAGRETPLLIAKMPILSKAYYATRSFDETSMEPPLGSGPYRIGRFEAGRYIEYERVKNWWGETLPTQIGLNNFDIVRAEFFRDREVAMEEFKARHYTFRDERTSRTWATQYDFPAVQEGKVKKVDIPTNLPASVQGYYINNRRDKFKDPRAREAIILAFDFEWVNQNIMYGAYRRQLSYFDNSPMKAEGKPSEAELKLLEPLRGKVPDEVFGEPWLPPVSDGTGQDRTLLRRAGQLLREAGFAMKDGKLLDKTGQQMTLEVLMADNSMQPHLTPFVANLQRLGIDASLRRVDAAQFQSRIKDYDFDVISRAFGGSNTPSADSLRTLYGSQQAATVGMSNYAGISSPAVDAMIDAVAAANTREELNVAVRALDRILRAGRHIIPAWYKTGQWFAYWDMFGHPQRKPKYGSGTPGKSIASPEGLTSAWWYDAAKAAKL